MPPARHPTPHPDTLLAFFKALADPNRLRIIGLLSRDRMTVEDLATELRLSTSTTSHHLKRLTEVGLVGAEPQGYYRYYSLREQNLRDMASRLLEEGDLAALSHPDSQFPSYDRGSFEDKVMRAFTEEGRILVFPTQEKKRRVLIDYVASAFDLGRRYTEKEVNAILERYNEDTAYMRRALVDYGIMDRVGGGGDYWLIVPPAPRH
jgi:DNA-binding transcriptional ArsR family regulator